MRWDGSDCLSFLSGLSVSPPVIASRLGQNDLNTERSSLELGWGNFLSSSGGLPRPPKGIFWPGVT